MLCTIYQRIVDSSLSNPEAQVGAKLRKCNTKDELAGTWTLCTIYQRIYQKNSRRAQFIKELSTLPFHIQKLKLAQSWGNAKRRTNWLEDGCCAQFIKGFVERILVVHNLSKDCRLFPFITRSSSWRKAEEMQDEGWIGWKMGSRTLPPCMSAQHSSGDSTSHMSQRWLFWCFFSSSRC